MSFAVNLIPRLIATALIAAATAVVPRIASAQVVVIVNGAPITAIDIEQRAKISAAGTNKPPNREQALKDLIDDQLKISKAKVYGLEISDSDVDESYASMAKRQRLNPQQFNEFLQRSGIAPSALKARIRAEMVWGALVRGKFNSSLQVGESDVTQAMQARSDEEKGVVGYVYTLYPVTIVVPRGSPETLLAQKSREAENLRNRFQDCKDGLVLARGLRDVAVREPLTRSSADLTPQLRELLSSMQIGRLTIPELTPQGLQMYALCEKKESASDAPVKKQVREELFTKKFEAEGKKFLEEIRRGAMIEYK